MSARPLAPLALGLLLAAPARAQELPAISQTEVTTPTRAEAEHDLGLELLWLPVESRASLTDYVGRNHPGAQLDANGELILSGGHPGDAAVELDGYRFGHLTPPLALVDRLGVANFGYGAAWNDAPAGVVGAATKGESPRLRTDLDAYNDFHASKSTALSLAVSAPIVRDRLFVVVAARDQLNSAPGQSDVLIGSVPGPSGHSLGAGLKLIWLPGAGQRLESLTLFQDSRRDNGAPLGIEPLAQPSFGARDLATGLRWMGRFGEAVTASSQVAFQSHRAEEMPLRCRADPTACDTVPSLMELLTPVPVISQNWPHQEIDRETRWQTLNTITARLFERPSVRERLRVSSRLDAHTLRWDSHLPGDRQYTLNGGQPYRQTTAYSNDPRFEAAAFGWTDGRGSSLRTAHALESETRLFQRLWLVPGIGLATGHAHGQALDFDATALTPHLAISWDVRGDGRAWLYAGSHQRVSTDLDQVLRLSRQVPTQQTCQWNPDTARYDKNCTFSGGRPNSTVNSPCSPTGVTVDGSSCRNPGRLERVWEHTVGGSYQVLPTVRLGADLVYRRSVVAATVNETNQIWNNSGTDMTGFRNGRAERVWDYTAANDDRERYLGVTAAIRKDAGDLRMLLSYTWSRHRNGIYVPPQTGMPVALIGLAADDRPHSIRAQMAYDVLGYASVGLLFSRDSGVPTRHLLASTESKYENYRATVGSNPGANINDPSDDRLEVERTAEVTRLNLQLRLRARRLLKVDADLYADALDLIQSSTTPPTYLRLGLELRY
jgi:hypothetical protein